LKPPTSRSFPWEPTRIAARTSAARISAKVISAGGSTWAYAHDPADLIDREAAKDWG
jgi:hypothetical protein